MNDRSLISDEDDALAAEYVIGLLDAEAREAASRRIRADAGFEARVSVWEAYLEDLNEQYGTLLPPARVKAAIDRRLFQTRKRRWLGWIPMGLAAAVVLVAFVLLPQIILAPADLRAQLESDGSPYVFSVAVDLDGQHIDMAVLSGEALTDGTFELWLIPEGGAPFSLGTFDTAERLDLVPDVVLAADTTLAISLEPSGGSPTGAPTGPVVAIGVLEDA